jgi:antitoxin HigA-1
MAELELTARALGRALDIPVNRVTQILKGQRAVTADSALRLGRYFRTSPDFWLGLQKDYELRRAADKAGAAIAAKVRPRAA